MSAEELEEHSKPSSRKKHDFSDYYGLGYWLKKYAKFPTSLPICLHCDHGPALAENLLPYELASKYSKAFFHNKLKIKDALKRKFRKVYVTGSPFVYYRRLNNISRSAVVEGTICFPIHSTANIDIILNWEIYISRLKQLPQKFHPITICLHHVDIEKGVHKIFLEHGFEVVSAGHKLNVSFVEKFYDIIKGKKYATSNSYGSYLPYCVEFGLPFFLYGEQKMKINNLGNLSFKLGVRDFEDFLSDNRTRSMHTEAISLFNNFSEEVTFEQKEFCQKVLGLDEALPARALRYILWKEFLRNFHKLAINQMNMIFNTIIKRIRRKIRTTERSKKHDSPGNNDFSQAEQDILSMVKPFTMTSNERIVSLIRAIEYLHTNQIEGDIVECGVWKGGSIMAMIATLDSLKVTDRRVWLFDTFEGMSEPTVHDKDLNGRLASERLQTEEKLHSNVWAYSTLEEVKANLEKVRYPKENITYVKGRVEETLLNNNIKKIALLRLDTDWYESTKLELEELYDKVSQAGIIIIDDYGHWEGCKRAVDEYIAKLNVPVFLNRIDYTARLIVKP